MTAPAGGAGMTAPAGGADAGPTGGRRVDGERTRVVREDDCASRWGNEGLLVLSTPAMLGLMEQTCVEVLAPVLAAGEMTVGVGVTLTHAAAARCGDPVTYRVDLTVEGRVVDVDFTVVGPTGTVPSGHGTHRRRIVDRTTFLRRLTPPPN